MAGRLYKRGEVWWAWFYEPSGRRICKSTQCTDKRAAELTLREWERGPPGPAYAAAHTATIGSALERLIIDRRGTGWAEGTLSREKAGNVVRLLGAATASAGVSWLT